MLTGAAHNCRVRGNRAAPFFPSDKRFGELAGAVMEIRLAAVAGHLSRRDSDEELETFRGVLPPLESMVVQGLDKIFCEAVEWRSRGDGQELRGTRRELFIRASEWRKLAAGDYAKFLSFREAYPACRSLGDGGCYADLPENDIAESAGRAAGWDRGFFMSMYRLEAYRSLLTGAGRVLLRATVSDPQQLRRLLRRMRFHRLLARVKPSPPPSGGGIAVSMEISGPADVLVETRKYGMNLACFFPAVTLLPEWELRAEITHRERKCELVIDSRTARLGGAAAGSSWGGAYEPEEFAFFRENFLRIAGNSWRLSDDTVLRNDDNGEVVIPDLCFEHDGDGFRAEVELFHRWHASGIAGRLEWLARHPGINMLIGVERGVLPRGGGVEAITGGFPSLAGRIFPFRDCPGAATVLKMLNGLLPGGDENRGTLFDLN